MSTDPFVKGVVPMTHGAQRRFLQRRSPGSSIPPTSAPPDKFKQVQTADLWQQKVVDEREALTMTIEELAALDQFDPKTRIDTPSFAHLPIETQLDMVRRLAEEVQTAPARKKEAAKQNLVEQLGSGAKFLGKQTWDGIKWGAGKVWNPDYIPGYAKFDSWWDQNIGGPAMKAFEWSGRQSASTIIETAQSFIPGEQTHERRLRLYREQKYQNNPNRWWSRLGDFATTWNANATFGFGPEGSEFHEGGFDVPMGVHLPLEIIFDPTNYIGVGLIAKVPGMVKVGSAVSAQLSRNSRAWRTYNAANEAGKAKRTAYEAQVLKEKSERGERMRSYWERQIRSNANLDTYAESAAEYDYGYMSRKFITTIEYPGLPKVVGTGATRGESRRAARHHMKHDPEDIYGETGMGRKKKARWARRGPGGDVVPGKKKKTTADKPKITTKEVTETPAKRRPATSQNPEESENFEQNAFRTGNPNLARRPSGAGRGIPGEPAREGQDVSALWEMISMPNQHPANRAALMAMYYFGVRPHELQNVKIGPQETLMETVFPSLSMPIKGKGNNRRMFGGKEGDAYKFMQEWIPIRKSGEVKAGENFEQWDFGPILQTEDVSGAVNRVDPEGDVFFVHLDGKNQPATAANINRLLKEAAQEYDNTYKHQLGRDILGYYGVFDDAAELAGKGNNNYAYVFRLAAASRWLQESRLMVGRSMQPVQMAMGHNSTRHTSRYFSNLLFEYSDAKEALEVFGFDPAELQRYIDMETIPAKTEKGKTKAAKKLFLEKEPGGATNQDVRERLRSQKTEFLINNIAQILDETSTEAPTLMAKVPDDITVETARGLHKLEELQTFMYYMDEVLLNKSFIQKEYGGSAEQVKQAKNAISILKSWRQPIIDAATQISDGIIGLDTLKPRDPAMPKEALEMWTNPFSLWQSIIISEELAAQKGFAALGRLGKYKEYLSSKLPKDAIAAMARTKTGKAVGTIEAKVARMSQDEIDEINAHFRDQLARGEELEWVMKDNPKQRIRPGMKGIEWDQQNPNQIALKDARLGPDGSTSELNISTGWLIRQEAKAGKEIESDSTWVVTQWKRDEAGNVEGAYTKKLASKPTDPRTGWKLRFARDQEEGFISIRELEQWRIISEAPVATDPTSSVFTDLIRPGRRPITADEIANYYFVSGNWNNNPWMSMDALRRQLSVIAEDQDLIDMGLDGLRTPAAKRLHNSKLLEVDRIGHKKYRYRWKEAADDGSEGVEAALERKRGAHGTHNEGWARTPLVDADGAGVGGPRVPGGPAGRSPDPDDFHELFGDKLPEGFNRMKFGDLELRDIITIPYGMAQPGKIFSGEGWGRKFFALLDQEKGAPVPFTNLKVSVPRDLQHWVRMLVPGTWGASPGGKLAWVYRIAGQQHADIASNVTFKLSEDFANAGILDDTFSGANIQLKPDADNYENIEEFVKAKAADRKKKKAALQEEDTGETLEEAGTTDWGDLADDTAEAGWYRTVDGDLRPEPHPYNVTRFRLFKKFQHDNPDKWDKKAIMLDEANWTYTQNTKFLGTFLATPRAHLDRYYVMTPQLQVAYDHYHEVQRQLMVMFEASGHQMEEIMGTTKWMDEFVPLMPTAKMSEDPQLGIANPVQGRGRIGAKPQTFLERQYDSHIQGKMMQGQILGRTYHEVYNNNPLAALSRQMTQTYDYILDEQFLNAFSKLGIDKAMKAAPNNLWIDDINPIRKAIRAHGADSDEVTDLLEALPNAKIEKFIKLFGSDWDDVSPAVEERLQRQLARYRDANAASESVSFNQGLNYVIDEHKIKEIAFDHESSRELMVLGSDMIDPVKGLLSGASAASNIMRVFATGADLGVLLLHGFGALGTMMSPTGFKQVTRPDGTVGHALPMQARLAWKTGALQMGKAMLQQMRYGKGLAHNVRREWYINTTAEREEMRKYGISFFRSTFSEDLPTDIAFLDTAKKVRPFDKEFGTTQKIGAIAPHLQRAKDFVSAPVDGFGFFLDVSKVEMWRAYRAIGLNDPNDLSELAASLNAIHGTLNPSVAGVHQKQRVFESAIMSYAAMYRRSAMALLKNATEASPEKAWRRGPALHALSGMAASGGAFGWAVWMLQEAGIVDPNEDLFNPGSPDFLALKAGGMRFGIGTPFYSMIRMGTDVVEQMQDDPAGLNPFNIRDNSVLRWARSQTSPVTSIVTDLLTGSTFINEPLHTAESGWEVNKIGDRISRTLIPFWLESQMHSDTRSFRGSLGELLGLRVSPTSPYSRLKAARNLAINLSEDPDIVRWREEQNAQGLPVSGMAIPRTLLRRLMDTSPELQQLEEEMSEQVQLRGTDERKEQDEFINQINANRDASQLQMQGIAVQFATGQMSGKAFRDAIREIEIGLRASNRQVAGNFEQVLDRFEERRADRADREAEYFVGDIVYDKYRMEVTNNPELHDEYGNFNMEVFLREQDKFKMEHAEYWPYVEERIKENQQIPGIVGEYYKAKDTLGDYWRLDETIWKKGSWQLDLLNNWRSISTTEGKAVFEDSNWRVKSLLRRLQWEQKKYRIANPSIDRDLVQFYDYNPVTAAGQRISRNRTLVALGSRQI